jgi:hypothetical protein
MYGGQNRSTQSPAQRNKLAIEKRIKRAIEKQYRRAIVMRNKLAKEYYVHPK